MQKDSEMFSKTADPTAAPAASTPRPRGNGSRSILASDLTITGEITSAGTLEVSGVIDGNVSADVLTLTGTGRIAGTINANSIEVLGKLEGKVDCETFTMRASAEVSADVTYETLVIESGATIDGRFNRSKM